MLQEVTRGDGSMADEDLSLDDITDSSQLCAPNATSATNSIYVPVGAPALRFLSSSSRSTASRGCH
jgi:hypothetical protein